MPEPRIRSAYLLDPETIRSLEEIALRLAIPESEVVKLAVTAFARSMPAAQPDRLGALEQLQAQLALGEEAAGRWIEGVTAERRHGT
jgi:hypothetical protein